MLQEAFELEGDRVWTAASGFGGGVARTQSMCGALTGASMAIGLRAGMTADDPKAIADAVRPRIRALVDGFREQFGGADCGELIPFDYSSPGGYDGFKASGLKQERCHRYVKYAVEQALA